MSALSSSASSTSVASNSVSANSVSANSVSAKSTSKPASLKSRATNGRAGTPAPGAHSAHVRVTSCAEPSLAELRQEIERVDALIIGAIAERMVLSRSAGRVKAATSTPVTDPAREAAVVARASALAREAGLPEDEIRALYWRLMAMSRRAQLDVQLRRHPDPQGDA